MNAEETIERLLTMRGITTTGCWEFFGLRNRQGYGQIRADGRNWGVHRLMYTLTNGPIPDGLFVLHSCDNPPCFNPDHLRVGTTQQNTFDSVLRGRHGLSGPTKPYSSRGSASPWMCVHGHPMTGDNVYVSPRGRKCRTCHQDRRDRYAAKLASQSDGEVK